MFRIPRLSLPRLSLPRLSLKIDMASDRWGLSIKTASPQEMARKYLYVDVLTLDDIEAFPFNYDGKLPSKVSEITGTKPATLCLYIANVPSVEYYKQEPIISTHSQYPITNRELIKSGFEVYYPRDAPGFLFCTDEANEPLFFSAFDRLVKKAGLQVGFDHRNLYLQAKTYKLAHATTSTKRQPVTTILTAASIADVVHS